MDDGAVRRLELDGEQIEVIDSGDGEPVLLIHGGVFSDWFVPAASALKVAGLRPILVRRAGYLPGIAPTRPLTIADHARHCALVLDALDVPSAHICGHSAGALIALQLALDAPTTVADLVLLEPAPAGDLASAADGQAAGRLLGPAFAAIAAGELDRGFDAFLAATGGPGGRALIEARLGRDGLRAAVRQAVSLIYERQAVVEWSFTSAAAAKVGQPILLVQGARSTHAAPFAPRTVAALAAMAPQARVVTLPDVTHLMPLQEPDAIAELIKRFVADLARSRARTPARS